MRPTSTKHANMNSATVILSPPHIRTYAMFYDLIALPMVSNDSHSYLSK